MKILLIILSLISTAKIFPCSCVYGGNFLKIANGLIAVVKVKEYSDFRGSESEPNALALSAIMEVVEILEGNETRKKIKVFGDNGMQCRPYIQSFKPGNTYILSISPTFQTFGEEFSMHDYFISICGEFWLAYDPDKKNVTGKIKDGIMEPITVSISEFKRLMRERKWRN
jgi:hypothetical protein